MQADKHTIQELKRILYDYWGTKTRSERDVIDFEVFGSGQDFLDFGTMQLKRAYDYYKIGLIEINPVRIDDNWDEFEVVELTPSFKEACLAYKRPTGFPTRSDSTDCYDEPNEVDDERDIGLADFQGAGVFLMSEANCAWS